MRIALGGPRAAAAGFVLIATAAYAYVGGAEFYMSWAAGAAAAVCTTVVLQKFGILAAATGVAVAQLIINNPATTDIHAWYFTATGMAVAVVAGLIAWCLWVITRSGPLSPGLRPS
jgi:hypothetical protein